MQDVLQPQSLVTRSATDMRAHLVGVRGSGMRAMAELLADRGWQLTGSDQGELAASESPLPFVPSIGHVAEHVPDDIDLLIHSPAVSVENVERRRARELGVREVSYVEMLADLMQARRGICISGTHGKTTTTAMVASILRECGLAPAAAIGGELSQYQRSGWWGDGPHLVVESCEYRRHFLAFSPSLAAVLNIEPDHFDCFDSMSSELEAFGAFAALLPADGRLVVPHGCELTNEVARYSAAEVETFSLEEHPEATWFADAVVTDGVRSSFRLWHRGVIFGQAELQIPGRHNISNALAATSLAFAAGASAAGLLSALGNFRGVRRRFECVGEWRGVTLIDDYAHHPTAVQATIRAARQCFGQRRLIAVFQPHQVSRTRGLMFEFASCFQGADQVLLAPIYAARESQVDAERALTELTGRVRQSGVETTQTTSLDHLRECVEHAARPGDVMLIMGAGDINRIGYDLARQLR